MKSTIYSIKGQKKSQIELPIQFSTKIRTDLIKRAVIAIQNNSRQRYGADPLAGTKQGDATPKRRRKYGTTYGYGVSRVKRKVLWHRGSRFGWAGAFVANAIGGRRAFPPKAEKDYSQKLNKKERRLAICSAIAATGNKDSIEKRTSTASKISEFPIILESKFETLSKTKQVRELLEKLGLKDELERVSKRKVRPGIAKLRGRKYKTKKGILFIVSKKCELQKAAKNLPGSDVAVVSDLNAKTLAPGAQPGRIAVWTESAIEELSKRRLFK